MTTVLLVRHGENDWVKKHRLAGWIPNIHLNERGIAQAQEVAQRLSQVEIQAIYSSPVVRCMETAVAIAKSHDLPVREVEEVGEVRYGDWEGKRIKKLAKKPLWHVVQHYPSRMRFPSGESLLEVQFRGVQAIERLSRTHKNEAIVIVSHADLIKLVLSHYLGVHIDLFQRIVISPASTSVLHLSDRGFVHVIRINDDGPLPSFAPPSKEENSEK